MQCWLNKHLAHLIVCYLIQILGVLVQNYQADQLRSLIWFGWMFNWENATPEIDATRSGREKMMYQSVGVVATTKTHATEQLRCSVELLPSPWWWSLAQYRHWLQKALPRRYTLDFHDHMTCPILVASMGHQQFLRLLVLPWLLLFIVCMHELHKFVDSALAMPWLFSIKSKGGWAI